MGIVYDGNENVVHDFYFARPALSGQQLFSQSEYHVQHTTIMLSYICVF